MEWESKEESEHEREYSLLYVGIDFLHLGSVLLPGAKWRKLITGLLNGPQIRCTTYHLPK